MDYKELSKRMRKRYLDNLNGLLQEPDDVFSDFNKAATAITDLLSRAEAAEQKATELDNALSNASKVVKTMQESTIPYYRKRAEAAEKEVEWKNKVIEAAERRFMEAEARAEKAERERDAYKEMIYKERPCAFCVEYTGNWNPECIRCDRCTKEYRPKFRLREQEEE